jgi:hypothetical protein
LFQNLATNITKTQTLGAIILLGRDFNACTVAQLDTIDINDLCELLQVLDFIETEHLGVVAKQHNRDASFGGWGCEVLDLCCDVGLLILNGWTSGDKSGEFTCLANGGRNIVDYIVDSPVVWQALHISR